MTKEAFVTVSEVDPQATKHRAARVKFFATLGVLISIFVGGAIVALIANEKHGVSHVNHVESVAVETNR